MKIHKSLIKPQGESVIPYILGTNALVLLSSFINQECVFLSTFLKFFTLGMYVPFSNHVTAVTKNIELKSGFDVINFELADDMTCSFMTTKPADFLKVKPFFDAFESGQEDPIFNKRVLSISNSKIDSIYFLSASVAKKGTVDYVALTIDGIVSFVAPAFLLNSFKNMEVKDFIWIPSFVSMGMCALMDRNTFGSKPQVDYLALKHSDNTDAEGFYDCYLVDHHGESVETITETISN